MSVNVVERILARLLYSSGLWKDKLRDRYVSGKAQEELWPLIHMGVLRVLSDYRRHILDWLDAQLPSLVSRMLVLFRSGIAEEIIFIASTDFSLSNEKCRFESCINPRKVWMVVFADQDRISSSNDDALSRPSRYSLAKLSQLTRPFPNFFFIAR